MRVNLKVLKNYLYNAAYQIFTLIVPLVTIPYISRVLGPTNIGINTLTNSTVQYFVLLANLGLTTYGQREIAYKRNNNDALNKTFWEIELISVGTTLISLLLFFFTLLFIKQYKEFYLAQGFLILASAFDISWLFMGLENFRITVIRNFIFKFVSIILIFTLVKEPSDTIVYILIISVLTVISNISLWSYLKKYIHKVSIKSLEFMKHVKPALQLFVPQIAISIYAILNKVMLGNLKTIQDAGFYDNSDKIIRICLTLLTAFSAVMMPHVAQAFVKGEKEKIQKFVKEGLTIALTFSFPLATGIIIMADKFVPWFFGSGFTEVVSVISIESIAIIPISCATIFGVQYLVPLNQNNKYTISILAGAFLNIIINIPLIHYFSANGAALATVLAETMVTAVQIYFVSKKINFSGVFKDISKIMLSCGLMIIVLKVAEMYILENFLGFAFEIIIGCAVYILSLIVLKANILRIVNRVIAHR